MHKTKITLKKQMIHQLPNTSKHTKPIYNCESSLYKIIICQNLLPICCPLKATHHGALALQISLHKKDYLPWNMQHSIVRTNIEHANYSQIPSQSIWTQTPRQT